MILLTGASGFLGSVIKLKYKDQILTLGRSEKEDIVCDLSKQVPVLPAVDLVIHAAGKAHSVPKTEAEKQEFHDVNITGTINLLTALTNLGRLPKAFVFISSVSVYGLESGHHINENSALNATDAYGKSKIVAETIIEKWCTENNIICSVLRLPLIAGYNPPGNLGSMVKGINKGYYFNVAGGKARKSIVLATDVADIIIEAANLGGIYNLTDGYHPSFSELSAIISVQLNKKSKPANIPGFLARAIGLLGDIIGRRSLINTNKLRKITSDLTFDDSKARRLLGWKPAKVLDDFRIK